MRPVMLPRSCCTVGEEGGRARRTRRRKGAKVLIFGTGPTIQENARWHYLEAESHFTAIE